MANGNSTQNKKKRSTSGGTGTKSPASQPPKKTAQEPMQPIRREVGGVLFLCLGLFMVISYFNTDGSFIAFSSQLLKGLLGWGFWLTAPAFFLSAGILFFHRGRPVELRLICALLLPVFFAAIADLLAAKPIDPQMDFRAAVGLMYENGRNMDCGGALGGMISYGLEKSLSVWGAMPVLLGGFIVCLILALRGGFKGLFKGVRMPERRPYQAPEENVQPDMEPVKEAPKPAEKKPEPRRGKTPGRTELLDIPLGEEEEELPLHSGEEARKARVRKRAPQEKAAFETFEQEPEPIRQPPQPIRQDGPVEEGFRSIPVQKSRTPVRPVPLTAEISDPPKGRKANNPQTSGESAAPAQTVTLREGVPDYIFPPTSLLRSGSGAAIDAREEIAVNRERLETAIRSFGINTSVVNVTRGPTVTRYDIELEQGVKLSRVTNLSDDLALALGVINVRIAPIPDKISTVGIEVPNKIVSTVYLRDIIESPRFSSAKSRISFALGRDIGGECIVGNIAKLPHLLIAGTTGSGKSVCMNSLILSLLYKARPDEVRLIMIDPKMVELGVYNGIPHLYVPVVTDPKKAAGALQWSVVEMLKRYRAFSEAGVRDLENYNRHCLAQGEQTLPQVVIVIDELADLMLVASKEVEESICRVAQMGRAAGMHLVIATQRPSADVITGLMKANIPSRIAFAVSSAMESRIILDQGGAEKLVGMGDMLFSPVGSGKPTRIQGAFVSDEEREDVIRFIKENVGESKPDEEIAAAIAAAAEGVGNQNGKGIREKDKEEETEAGGYDEMLPQAVEVVLETGSCSVSMLQRRVKLGYSRAARIVDQMEELGVVGPYEGAKPRSVVIDRQGWHDLAVQLGLMKDDMDLAAQMSEEADAQ